MGQINSRQRTIENKQRTMEIKQKSIANVRDWVKANEQQELKARGDEEPKAMETAQDRNLKVYEQRRTMEANQERNAPVPGRIKANSADAAISTGTDIENVVIIGSGPAAYTAAIYAARANLKPTVFGGYQVGGVLGEQLMRTAKVENLPGFPDGISWPDFLDRIRRQAEQLGAKFFHEVVETIDLQNRPFTVQNVKCHTVILATGALGKRLRLPGEDEFWSRDYDGASPLEGQVLAVSGAGDTTAEEALYLSKYASHVHLLARKDQLGASKALEDRVHNDPNITLHFNVKTVVDVLSSTNGQMFGIVVQKADNGEEYVLKAKGFYGTDYSPDRQLLEGQVELHSSYVLVEERTGKTSVKGVFAARDEQDEEWRQAMAASDSGRIAALSVQRYLARKDFQRKFHQDVQEGFDITLTKHKGKYAFERLFYESPRLICVLYTSPTCRPSRILRLVLNEVIDEFDQGVHFVEIDVEEDPVTAKSAQIKSTPCVQYFKNEKMLRMVSGVKMGKKYIEFIEANK